MWQPSPAPTSVPPPTFQFQSEHDGNTTNLSEPSILTRSMARRTSSSSSTSKESNTSLQPRARRAVNNGSTNGGNNNNNGAGHARNSTGVTNEYSLRRSSNSTSSSSSSSSSASNFQSTSSRRPPVTSTRSSSTIVTRRTNPPTMLPEIAEVPNENNKRKRSATSRTAKSVAHMSGMGVRVGPSVVGMAQRSPAKALGASVLGESNRPMGGGVEAGNGAQDPFSLDFRTDVVVRSISMSAGMEDLTKSTGGGTKRSLETEEEERNKLVTMYASPAKRAHLNPTPARVPGEGPSTFLNNATSPSKSTLRPPPPSSQHLQSSPHRLHFHHDLKQALLASPSKNSIPPTPISTKISNVTQNQNTNATASTSSVRRVIPLRREMPHSVEEDEGGDSSEEDDLDFLSPQRKKARSEAFVSTSTTTMQPPPRPSLAPAPPSTSAAVNSMTPMRSPAKQAQRVPAHPLSTSTNRTLPPPSSIQRLPASVAMSRPSYTFASDSNPTSVPMSRPSFNLPTLSSTSHSRSSLPSKYIPPPSAAASNVRPAPASARPAYRYMTSNHASGNPPPTPGFRSGIPGLTTSTTSTSITKLATAAPMDVDTSLPPPITSTSDLAESSSSATLPLPDPTPSLPTPSSSPDLEESVDTTMEEPSCSLTEISSSAAGNTSMGMSQSTSEKLANLHKMLSRLAMPRAPIAATQSAQGRSRVSSARTAVFVEEYEVPIKEDGKSTRRGSPPPPAMTTGSGRARSSTIMGPPPPGASSTSTRRTSFLQGAPQPRAFPKPSASSFRGPNPNAPTKTQSLPNAADLAPSILGPLSTNTANGSQARAPSRRASTSFLPAVSSATAVIDGEISAKPKSAVLKGVVAFVDVRTSEGDDAGMIFVDMLRSMGARVTTRPTLTLTHIVYKSGRPGTLAHFRTHPDPKPLLVGISWVVRCAEVGRRVEEKTFTIECDKEPTFQKRRRSMEPRAVANLGNTLTRPTAAAESSLKATIAASIDRARQRSLKFQPKIGSPLAKRVFTTFIEEEEEEEGEE